MGVNLFLVRSAVMLLSGYYLTKAQPTVSGDYPKTCDNMLQCQYQITQLDKKVDNLESGIRTILEELDSRTNDILTKLSQIDIPGPKCNQTYFECFKGKTYEFLTTPKDRQAARDDCGGGDLVAIESAAEWGYLHDFIYKHDYDNQCTAFWTSGEKRGDKWVWANGDQKIDLPWPENEPSGDGSCVTLHGNFDFRINDGTCSSKLCYICEYQ